MRTRWWAVALAAIATLGGAASAAPAQAVTTLRGDQGYDAVIRQTSHGIPHIIARDYAGMGYGYGYAFARENICTIAQEYVTVSAERSRFFGPDATWRFEGNGSVVNNLNSDFFFQRIKDRRIVETLLAKKPPNGPRDEIRDGVRGYVAGYNRYLKDTGAARLPDETCRGKPWVRPIEEIDVYRYFYMLALLASQGVAIDGVGAAAPPTAGLPAPLAASRRRTLLSELARRFGGLMGAGSNAYGLGAEATADGRGMVVGNPHFPWHGAQRFYQSHLTIPGKVDVAGASLFGVPIVLIGHTKRAAWSHTVSTARRFTPFELKLVPGAPTSYLYDGQVRQMRADRVTVKVPGAGGGLEDRTRTLYSSHHGPLFTSILGLPLFPWTSTTAHAMGDANADNFRYLNHFFEKNHAQSVREIDTVLRRNQGIPWVNTIAADSRGEAYYADIGVVPNVPRDHAAACNTTLGTQTYDLLGIPILDGSRGDCEWRRDPDALQPGTFGPRNMPSLIRRDYVTNSNDSYWLSNPQQPLEGFARIIGDEGTPRALRTRLGLIMVQQRIAGNDGLSGRRFTLSQLQDVVFNNRVYAGELFKNDLITLCQQNPVLTGSKGPVDVREACPALAAWDVRDDLDSRGAVLFRRFGQRALAAVGGVIAPPGVFRDSFSRADPVNTPRALNTDSPAIRQAFADAVQDLRDGGIPLDARLREYQSEKRGDERVPIHGGPHGNGVFNVITAPFAGREGFPDVNHGSSFVMAAHLTPGCPESRSILTYSQSATNAGSRFFADQTRLYSRKQWVDMRFCTEEVLRDRELRVTELGCVGIPGLRAATVRGRSGRLRLAFRRTLGMPVSVAVFRAGGRLVASFRRSRSFTSRKRLRRGLYFARFKVLSATGKVDHRYVAFRVRRGRVRRTARFHRPDSCGAVRSFRLSRPAFGRRPLRIAYRLNRRSRVAITVRRGRRTVRRFRTRTRREGRTFKHTLRAKGLRRGRYRVRLAVRSGRRRGAVTLSAVR